MLDIEKKVIFRICLKLFGVVSRLIDCLLQFVQA